MAVEYAPSDIKNLPKYMQRKPEIRSLTLKVYPGEGPRHFRVPGTDVIHDVFILSDSIRCSCKAAYHGATCSHSLAVKRYCDQKEKT